MGHAVRDGFVDVRPSFRLLRAAASVVDDSGVGDSFQPVYMSLTQPRSRLALRTTL